MVINTFFFLFKYDELQRMNAKDLEELTLIREEKRTLSITVENIKSELNQLQSKVYICRTLMMAILFTWVDVETFLCFR